MFVGRVIGKTIYDGRLLDAYFALYRRILGKLFDYWDAKWTDPTQACWIPTSASREMRCVSRGSCLFNLNNFCTVWRYQNRFLWKMGSRYTREQAGVRAVISSVSAVHLHRRPIGKPPFRLLRDYPKDLSLSYVNDRFLSVSLNWHSKTLTFGSGALQRNSTSGIRAQILVVTCTQMIPSR